MTCINERKKLNLKASYSLQIGELTRLRKIFQKFGRSVKLYSNVTKIYENITIRGISLSPKLFGIPPSSS